MRNGFLDAKGEVLGGVGNPEVIMRNVGEESIAAAR